ncbi:D-arabinono-1,4-lactone oxidase [Allomesorhizobium camelthorni]|uniref:FAD-binding protein n=1 Tax=Allomesorhizobium camelthorni TaxID=475069 RepID=A0A6G4WLM8_9HYPH|nr:D-arabinono-1,4-lactone oxidase [Mesorhizobium camelthorni]NGO55671.1 FAD-binding protein [Mesorhizobium camelthorni]
MSSSVTAENTTSEWVNWFGNQRCVAHRIEYPTTEAAVQEAVGRAVDQGLSIRVIGGGHSLTPVVLTDGVLLNITPAQDIAVDLSQQTARIAAGHMVHHVADRLWDAGAALKNLGELKAATMVGAVSTGVHGTGIELPCLAASVRGARLVTADGSVVNITEADSELLRAVKISLGMLGVITELTVTTLPAYRLHERSFYCSANELADRWDELAHTNRHFSFFYLPDAAAVLWYSGVVPQIMTALGGTGETAMLDSPTSGDTCLVTVRDLVDVGSPAPTLRSGERCDRMDRILTYDFTSPYREIEFAIPFEIGARTFLELRGRLRKNYPAYDHPVLVRFAAEDDSMLSWLRGGPKVIFSLTDDADAPYDRMLADFENFFDERGALPHWGKEHSLNVARLRRLKPEFEHFRTIRRELDPRGIFLNDHLRPLFE